MYVCKWLTKYFKQYVKETGHSMAISALKVSDFDITTKNNIWICVICKNKDENMQAGACKPVRESYF